jgi:SH3-like domain-containing protein
LPIAENSIRVQTSGQIEVALGVKAERAPSAQAVEESLRKLRENKRIRGEQVLLRDPDFKSPPVIKVPKDTKLKVLKRQGDWFEVEYQGKTGWLYRKAFWVSW